MTNLRYRIYYQYDGPSKAAPLRSPKTDDEIEFALSRVKTELEHFLGDDEARVSQEKSTSHAHSIVIDVVTKLPRQEALGLLERCIGGLDLYGERLL